MNRTRVLQEIRIIRLEDIYQSRSEKKLTVEEAAEILGVSERTFRRWSRRYEAEGAQGLYDSRIEKAAHNCASVDEILELATLFETHYSATINGIVMRRQK